MRTDSIGHSSGERPGLETLCDPQDDVNAAIALYHLTQLAHFQSEGGFFKWWRHFPAREFAQVSPTLGAALTSQTTSAYE